MKTIKLIAVLAIALAASAASAAVDSYLYWMVDGANYGGSDVAFDYATISVDGGATYLNLYGADATTSDLTEFASAGYLTSTPATSTYGAPTQGLFAGFDSSAGVNTFLIELWLDSQTERVAWQTYSYEYLASFISGDTKGGSSAPFGVTDVVPEPTSGLLSLFGLAALALRRRRRA